MNNKLQKSIDITKKLPAEDSIEDSFENNIIYEVNDLSSARVFLNSSSDKVILTNPEGSTRYYGMRVIDYMFKQLQKEFPNKIIDIIVNAYNDNSAFITSKQLGYKNIKYMNIGQY